MVTTPAVSLLGALASAPTERAGHPSDFARASSRFQLLYHGFQPTQHRLCRRWFLTEAPSEVQGINAISEALLAALGPGSTILGTQNLVVGAKEGSSLSRLDYSKERKGLQSTLLCKVGANRVEPSFKLSKPPTRTLLNRFAVLRWLSWKSGFPYLREESWRCAEGLFVCGRVCVWMWKRQDERQRI